MVNRKKPERIRFSCDKTAEIELTCKTMVEIVMLVRNLRFAGIVRVLTFFVREFGDNVLERVNRLEQYRRQYCNNQRNIQYDEFSFHSNSEVRQRIKKSVLI